jgi:hypothetical protein
MGTNLTGMHMSPNPKTSHIVLIGYEYDALKFSSVGQEVESKGEESQEGPQVGDSSNAHVSPNMIGDTQLVECSHGNESGSSAKSSYCLLIVAKKSQ